jgi:hypothetical protein
VTSFTDDPWLAYQHPRSCHQRIETDDWLITMKSVKDLYSRGPTAGEVEAEAGGGGGWADDEGAWGADEGQAGG